MFQVQLSELKSNMLLTVIPNSSHIVNFIETLEREKTIRINSSSRADIFNILYCLNNLEYQGLEVVNVRYVHQSGTKPGCSWIDVDMNFIEVSLCENYDTNSKSIILLSEFS